MHIKIWIAIKRNKLLQVAHLTHQKIKICAQLFELS